MINKKNEMMKNNRKPCVNTMTIVMTMMITPTLYKKIL
jgi:hypothetical protein